MNEGVREREASAAEALEKYGYQQTLRRGFGLWSVFALAFAFISPIVALYAIFGLAFAAGGPAFWWGFPLTLAMQLLVALVFAELASIWPLAGGVYQWSRQVMGSTFGWFAGWAYMWTLVIAMSAVAYGAAGFLAAVFGISEPSPLTLVLLALGVLAFGTFANTVGRNVLKFMVSASIAAEILGSLVIGTVLLLFYRENSFAVVFDAFGTAGGQSYVFGPFLAAVAFVGWAFVGFESAGSMAEEVEDPNRDVPRAILLSLVAVAFVVMYTGLAIILAIPNIGAVVAGNVGDPITDTLDTKLGAWISTPLFVVIVVGFTAALMAIQASASRVVFSFARDGALPASGFLGRLSTSDRLPINAILLTAVVTAALFFLANSDIYTTLVSFTTGGFYIAFFFPVLAALLARLGGRWRPGRVSLGRPLGLLVNVLATVWLLFEIVNIAWPRTPDLAWYQNYGVVVMIVALGVLGLAAFLPLRGNISRMKEQDEEASAARSSGT